MSNLTFAISDSYAQSLEAFLDNLWKSEGDTSEYQFFWEVLSPVFLTNSQCPLWAQYGKNSVLIELNLALEGNKKYTDCAEKMSIYHCKLRSHTLWIDMQKLVESNLRTIRIFDSKGQEVETLKWEPSTDSATDATIAAALKTILASERQLTCEVENQRQRRRDYAHARVMEVLERYPNLQIEVTSLRTALGEALELWNLEMHNSTSQRLSAFCKKVLIDTGFRVCQFPVYDEYPENPFDLNSDEILLWVSMMKDFREVAGFNGDEDCGIKLLRHALKQAGLFNKKTLFDDLVYLQGEPSAVLLRQWAKQNQEDNFEELFVEFYEQLTSSEDKLVFVAAVAKYLPYGFGWKGMIPHVWRLFELQREMGQQLFCHLNAEYFAEAVPSLDAQLSLQIGQFLPIGKCIEIINKAENPVSVIMALKPGDAILQKWAENKGKLVGRTTLLQTFLDSSMLIESIDGEYLEGHLRNFLDRHTQSHVVLAIAKQAIAWCSIHDRFIRECPTDGTKYSQWKGSWIGRFWRNVPQLEEIIPYEIARSSVLSGEFYTADEVIVDVD